MPDDIKKSQPQDYFIPPATAVVGERVRRKKSPRDRISKPTAAEDPLGLDERLTKEARQRRRAAERGVGKAKAPSTSPESRAKPVSSLDKLTKAEKRVTQPGILKRFGGKVSHWAGAIERSALKQAAKSGGRGALARSLVGTASAKAWSGPLMMAADVAAIGGALYTGYKALQAHKELKRKEEYAEKHYGSVAKASETRRQKAAKK